MEAGDNKAACAHFGKAVELEPRFAEAHANLGMLLDRQGDKSAAEAAMRRAIEISPHIMQPHLNLGALLAGQKRHEEAETAYRKALALQPSQAAVWSNLGALYASMKLEKDAEHCCRVALSLDKNHAAARLNLSYVLLRQGRLEEGFQHLEARQWQPGFDACPPWQGEAVAGKSLLIVCEGGFGDMLHFCRYAAVLKTQGAAAVALAAPQELAALLATLKDADRIYRLDEPLSDAFDFWTPLFSLPYRCNTRLDFIPAAAPYLFADPERVRKWAPSIPKHGFRVGLVWRGNATHENDADRSMASLDVLAPLWQIPGVEFISLQKGGAEAETPSGLPLLKLGNQLDDFADTAAVMAHLDLVITVDTAAGHLAGALKKPCWVLLPAYKPDWRWFAGRRDTPWYPDTHRLFQQEIPGNWSAVVAEIALILRLRLQNESG